MVTQYVKTYTKPTGNIKGKERETSTVGAVHSASGRVTFEDEGEAVVTCTLPANSQIIEMYTDTYTAFNATVGNILSYGITGELDRFSAVGTELGAAGRNWAADIETDSMTNWENTGDSKITILATYTATGDAPTAGVCRVIVNYIPGNNL